MSIEKFKIMEKFISVSVTDFGVYTPIKTQEGQTRQIEYYFIPESSTSYLEFSSDDESIMTVSRTGEITGVLAGNATLSVTCDEIVKTIDVDVEIY